MIYSTGPFNEDKSPKQEWRETNMIHTIPDTISVCSDAAFIKFDVDLHGTLM